MKKYVIEDFNEKLDKLNSLINMLKRIVFINYI